MAKLTERSEQLKNKVRNLKSSIAYTEERRDQLIEELNKAEVEQYKLRSLARIERDYQAGEPVLFANQIWFYSDNNNLDFDETGEYSIATVEEVRTTRLATYGLNQKRKRLLEEWLAKNEPNINPLKPGDIVTCRDASWSFSITPRAEIKHIPISASLFKYEGVYQNQKRRTVIAIAPPGKPFPFRPSPVPPGKWENNTIVQDEDGTLHFVHHKGLIKVDD